MTADEFRQLALSFPGTEEGSHMGHADFRVRGKVFASLNAAETDAMAKLTPDQQTDLISRHPETFRPASGKWGLGGATMIVLAKTTQDAAGEALTLAHQNLAK